MSREAQFARQICRLLNQGTADLDHGIAERLRAAREQALQRQHAVAYSPAIVSAGGTAVLGGGGDERHPLRMFLTMLALMLGVSLAYYWNGFSQASDNAVIDTALLADDLPPNAYLDKGFQAWLEKDSPAGQ